MLKKMSFTVNDLREDICNYLEPLNSQDIDVLILGCTHFPIIEKEIRSCCRQNTEVISSAIETAKDVKEILLANGYKCFTGKQGGMDFLPDREF